MDNWERILSWTVYAVVTLALGLGGYALIRTAAADGRTEYCYIQYWSPQGMPPVHSLNGYRQWRSDRTFGTYSTFDEAVAKAKSIDCLIK